MSKALDEALKAYEKYRARPEIENHQLILIVDYTVPSYEKRLFLYDRSTKHYIRAHHVAHGANSCDPSDPAHARWFSNKVGSLMSSTGAGYTGSFYFGKHGKSLNLHGFEKGVNDNMFLRRVVLHHANYVSDAHIHKYGSAGLSWGCPAVDKAVWRKVSSQGQPLIDFFKRKMFFYFHGS